MKPYLVYLGGGFFPGVPARNLTKEEAVKYGERRLIESGLYMKPSKKIALGGSENKGVKKHERN